jgi:cardiolipin hydrolase
MTAHLVFGLLGLALFGKTLHFYMTQYRGKDNKALSKAPRHHVNEVLFFPDPTHPCPKVIRAITNSPNGRNRPCDNISCRKLHNRPGEKNSSMIRFLEYLASARRSVDLCIYLFTQTNLGDILEDLHKKSNIRIRIITDSTEDDAGYTQVKRLRSNGIMVKSNRRGTGALMHHKYVIIDGSILLTGSFNWTNKAVVSNYEAVLVSTEPSLVGPFREKFEEMWNNFQPHFAI